MHRASPRAAPLAGAGLLLAAAAAVAQTSGAGNPLDVLPRTPAPAQARTEVQVQAAPQPLPAALAQAITPTRFDIEGVGAVPFAEVAALFSPLVGRDVRVADVVERARQASALYVARGYAISFVYVPQQAFEQGVVRVVAVEGHVASVRIDGDAGKARERVQSIARHVVREKPLTTRTFERYTALLGRLPGLSVQASVPLPGTTDGATEMALAVKRTPFNVSFGTQVRQPQSRAVVTGTLNDPLVAGGQLAASTLLGHQNGERFSALQYTQAIGDEGLALKASLSSYRGDPDAQAGIASPLDHTARNLRRELSATYPLRLSASSSTVIGGGIYGIDNDDTLGNPATGAFLAEQTRVRAAFAQLTWADATPQRSRSVNLLLAHGTNRFGARDALASNVPGLSGPGAAKLDFTRLALDAAYARRFANGWGTALTFGGQYSPDTLPSVERVSFGGSRYARAYAPGDAAGDRGWGAGIELNRSFAVDAAHLRQVQPYVLVERARVWGDAVSPAFSRLSSLSAGFRVGDLLHYTVDLALSRPTGDASPANPQRAPRFNLILSWNFNDG